MLRTNHYDCAFEAYLRRARCSYVAVDETRRALLAEVSLKSVDFVVTGGSINRLVDIKGRRFPSGPTGTGATWENWVTRDDIDSLTEWQKTFGGGFRSALVFAYHIVNESSRSQHSELFEFHGRTYAFYGVEVEPFAAVMRQRSPKWGTVSLPADQYRQLRTPFREWLR